MSGAPAGLIPLLGALLTAAGLLSGSVSAGATSTGAMVRLSSGHSVPKGADVLSQVGDSTSLSGEVSLAPADPGALSAYATAVSTPGSAEFHQYLSPGTFAQQFGATSSTLSATASWLNSAGLTGVKVDADHLFVHFSGTAATINSTFGFSVENVKAGNTKGIVPSAGPLVPAALSSRIAGVLGLDTLVSPHDSMVKDPKVTQPVQVPLNNTALSAHAVFGSDSASPDATCAGATALAGDGALSAQDLANAYGFGSLYNQGRLGAGVTVALVELEPYSPSDIDTYFSCYGISPQVTNISVDGGPGTGPGEGEAAMDIEAVAGLAPESHIEVYQGVPAAQATDANMIDILERIAQDDTAKVVSTSWGGCESDEDSSLLNSENTIFQQMAVQGQTMFAASGDSGSEACFISSNAADTSLAVSDPSSQPYVTGVGGVTLTSSGSGYSQTTWNNCQGQAFASCADGAIGGAGGGGVSADWAKPSWQTVSGSGREVPDVSASADPDDGDAIAWAGGWEPIAGTSAAAPLWAAATALVDQGCATTVGFLNPLLYTRSAATMDIVSGNNDYTDTHGGTYAAGVGYDMATGLGVPNGANLAAALEPLGCPSVSALSATSGPATGGNSVTISGVNLTTASAVHFGGSTAPYTVNASNGTLSATVPAGSPGTVAVTITTSAGTSAATDAASYTYSGSAALPVVTLVNPDGAPVSGRPDVSVTGSGFTGATAVMVGTVSASFTVQSNTSLTLSAPAAPGPEIVDITVIGPGGSSAHSEADLFYYDSYVSLDYVHGYTAASADGNVYAVGEAPYYGSMYGKHLNAPIVGMATTPSEQGYWLDASDGGIFAFGNAGFYGSMGGHPLNKPIVGMASTPDGKGYWEVASDGGIFSFGDARFFGSTGNIHLNKPIVGMATTADGLGYWLVASDGGIFAFGDAQFFGSTGGIHLNKPIESMAAMPDGGGYWLLASDGGIFAFGDAPFYGSAAGHGGTWNAMAVAPPGVGYMLMSSSGVGLTCGHGFYVFGTGWGTIQPTAPLIGLSFYATDSSSS
jgi:hypothetical protein